MLTDVGANPMRRTIKSTSSPTIFTVGCIVGCFIQLTPYNGAISIPFLAIDSKRIVPLDYDSCIFIEVDVK